MGKYYVVESDSMGGSACIEKNGMPVSLDSVVERLNKFEILAKAYSDNPITKNKHDLLELLESK